jgi:hypothetical protein
VVLCGLLVAALAGVAAYSAGHTGFELFFAVLTLLTLMTCYFAFLMTSFANDLWLLTRRYPALRLLPLYFTAAVYLLFAAGTGTFAWQSFGAILAFVALPTMLVQFSQKDAQPAWSDWLAVALIWLPFDLGLLKNVWLWPVGTGAYILNTAVAVCLAIYLFSSTRRLPDIGARLVWRRGDFRIVAAYFLTFCAVAIPFGVATDFIEFNVRKDIVKGLVAPFGIFLFIAVPEELLFRGLLQNFLSRRFGNEKVALVAAAIFFGATHLNNEPLMDWRYFTLATGAGLVYGAAYMKTRNLFVPAVIHALVDAVWMQLLWKGG